MIALLMHLWPVLAALGGLGGLAALIAFIPGGPALALRFWPYIAIAALAALAMFFLKLSDDRATALATANERATAAEKRADEWKAHSDKVEALAQETEAARSAERTQLINLARSAGTAKQGIANAPGAADTFRFSDAAYGFLRDHGSPSPAPAAEAPAGVDKR